MEQFVLNNLWILPFVLIAVIWSLVWKGLALWKAARSGSVRWFAALLIVNTLGILEIFYIYFFSEKSSEDISKGREN